MSAEPKKIREKEEASPEGGENAGTRAEQAQAEVQAQPTPQEALYAQFVRNNMILTVEDVAAYSSKDGAMVVVFTDPIGRSLVNVSFHIRPEILKKLVEASKKA